MMQVSSASSNLSLNASRAFPPTAPPANIVNPVFPLGPADATAYEEQQYVLDEVT